MRTQNFQRKTDFVLEKKNRSPRFLCCETSARMPAGSVE
jgi:hypothetical protein